MMNCKKIFVVGVVCKIALFIVYGLIVFMFVCKANAQVSNHKVVGEDTDFLLNNIYNISDARVLSATVNVLFVTDVARITETVTAGQLTTAGGIDAASANIAQVTATSVDGVTGDFSEFLYGELIHGDIGDATYMDSETTTLNNYFNDKNGVNGFPDRTLTNLTFTNGSREFTIGPSSATDWVYYYRGERIVSSATATNTISDEEGVHIWHFADASGVISEATTWSDSLILDSAIIASVYWDTTNNEAIHFADERHGMDMSAIEHEYHHDTVGALYPINEGGLAFANFDINGTGDDQSNVEFSVSDGAIFDEDIEFEIDDDDPQDLSPIAYIPVMYLDGSNWRIKAVTTAPVLPFGAGDRLAYNNSGSQSEVGNNDFVLAHIWATNCMMYPIVAIQGQAAYGNLTAARNGANEEINALVTTGLPTVEWVVLGTIIYQTGSGYANTFQARIRSTDTGDDYVDFRGTNFAGSGASANDHSALSNLEYSVSGHNDGNFSVNSAGVGGTLIVDATISGDLIVNGASTLSGAVDMVQSARGTSPITNFHLLGAGAGGITITNTDTGSTAVDGLAIGLDAGEDARINIQESGKSILFQVDGDTGITLESDRDVVLTVGDLNFPQEDQIIRFSSSGDPEGQIMMTDNGPGSNAVFFSAGNNMYLSFDGLDNTTANTFNIGHNAYDGSGNFAILFTLDEDGDGNFVGALTAASYTDNTPGYDADALALITGMKQGADGHIDHSTLGPARVPRFKRRDWTEYRSKSTGKVIEISADNLTLDMSDVTVEEKTELIPLPDGRDLGMSISILNKAIKQLMLKNNLLRARVAKLEAQ